jgi:hypothetical protein
MENQLAERTGKRALSRNQSIFLSFGVELTGDTFISPLSTNGICGSNLPPRQRDQDQNQNGGFEKEKSPFSSK